MPEQKPSKTEQVKELAVGLGLLIRLAFDPRTDPLVIEFFTKRKQTELKEKGKHNG